MCGFLSTFLVAKKVNERTNLIGHFVGFQDNHITLTLVQTPLPGGKHPRLTIFNFGIETDNEEHAYDKNQMLLEIQKPFPMITMSELDDAIEKTRQISIKREVMNMFSKQKVIMGEKLPFEVTSHKRPLNTAYGGYGRFGKFGALGTPITYTDMKKFSPIVHIHDFTSTTEKPMPKFLAKAKQLFVRSIIRKTQRELRPGDLGWFMDGILMHFKNQGSI